MLAVTVLGLLVLVVLTKSLEVVAAGVDSTGTLVATGLRTLDGRIC